MKQNRGNGSSGKLRKSRETRTMLASRFRVLCSDAGLSIDAVAQTLHVTPRTVRYWFSGKSAVPYAAYKLVRVMRWFELPQKGFEGWCMHSGKLWTPEGIPIAPEDGGWWSLLVRQARCFRTLYQRSADFERALMMLTAKGLSSCDAPSPATSGAAVPLAGAGAAGANLFKGHFGTEIPRNRAKSPVVAIKGIAPIPHTEMGVSHG
jgi:transcriptional regulator with XRE-family HTH domain